MDFEQFQRAAATTDQRPGRELGDLAVHLLGLVGEAGSVATAYKKVLRDGPAHVAGKAKLREEIGDVLWYLAAVSSHLDLDLDDIAQASLEKTTDRWLRTSTDPFDDAFPEGERLPRQTRVEFHSTERNGRPAVTMSCNGHWGGDPLTDASHADDGYRFHDVFHLAHAAVLGWSPVTRKLLGCKRRSDLRIDEAEDGGRAIVIEEGVAALVFAYASSHDYLRGLTRVDSQLLETIRDLVAPLEVAARSSADWERAIFTGYRVWDQLRISGGGTVTLDADAQTLTLEDDEAPE